MKITCVHIRVKPQYIDEFMEATRLNHAGSVNEPGNLRFDVLQDDQDPTKFMLYEVFISEEAAAAHKQTDHYFAWRKTVSDWMAEPRYGVPYKLIEPKSPERW